MDDLPNAINLFGDTTVSAAYTNSVFRSASASDRSASDTSNARHVVSQVAGLDNAVDTSRAQL